MLIGSNIAELVTLLWEGEVLRSGQWNCEDGEGPESEQWNYGNGKCYGVDSGFVKMGRG